MSSSLPVGIFDSWIGGLTVAGSIHHLLPGERLIYFGDTAHLPYGDKSPEAIKYYSLKIARNRRRHSSYDNQEPERSSPNGPDDASSNE